MSRSTSPRAAAPGIIKHRIARFSLCSLLGLGGLISPDPAPASASTAAPGHEPGSGDGRPDAPVGAFRRIDVDRAPLSVRQAAARATFPPGLPQVGSEHPWPVLDWTKTGWDASSLKDFTLRAVGKHVEIWVASGADDVSEGLGFPRGDCRNDVTEDLVVTTDQAAYLAREFDRRIRPGEGGVLGFPKRRDGSHGTWPGLAPNAFAGQGDNVVVLLDNIRDERFYRSGGGSTSGYVAPGINELVDRNLVTVDAFAARHRMGPDPAGVPGNDRCTSRLATPYGIEGVLAHEYAHVLQYDAGSFGEKNWIEEGLADWAQVRVGYVDPVRGLDEPSMVCWRGFASLLPPDAFGYCPAGPSLSFTEPRRREFAFPHYGAALHFNLYLEQRFGTRMIGDLHLGRAEQGLVKLAALLREHHVSASVTEVVHDWSAMAALDGVLDDGAVLVGGDERRFRADTLHSSIAWSSPFATGEPGIAPGGADFIRLRDEAGEYLDAGDLAMLEVELPAVHPPNPVEWTSSTTPDGPVYHSGGGNDLDRSIIRPIHVDPAHPTVTFTTEHVLEPGYDFAVVQVSTDGGQTFQTRPATTTTTDHAPDAGPDVVASLPGFTGNSGGALRQTVDLSDLAGRDVLLRFRLLTDRFVFYPGLRLWDIRNGLETISTPDFAGWSSYDEVHPAPIVDRSVQLVAHTDDHTAAWVARVPLGPDGRAELTRQELRRLVGSTAETVAVIINVDDPSETRTRPVPYELVVNGVVQGGGAP